MAGHVAPEAAAGGPIAVVEEGDMIAIDIPNRRLDIEIKKKELKRRLKGWKPRKPNYTTGVFAKYAKLVSGAERGAVTS
jgi:dihydroxy-acid dehydratase